MPIWHHQSRLQLDIDFIGKTLHLDRLHVFTLATSETSTEPWKTKGEFWPENPFESTLKNHDIHQDLLFHKHYSRVDLEIHIFTRTSALRICPTPKNPMGISNGFGPNPGRALACKGRPSSSTWQSWSPSLMVKIYIYIYMCVCVCIYIYIY